jgi:hypothetical protein
MYPEKPGRTSRDRYASFANELALNGRPEINVGFYKIDMPDRMPVPWRMYKKVVKPWFLSRTIGQHKAAAAHRRQGRFGYERGECRSNGSIKGISASFQDLLPCLCGFMVACCNYSGHFNPFFLVKVIRIRHFFQADLPQFGRLKLKIF